MEQKTQPTLSPTVAIIIAGILIAGAIMYSNSISRKDSKNTDSLTTDTESMVEVDIKLMDKDDHIRGSITAPVVIIEYADYDCVFCKKFHNTMNQIMKKYDGKVAWVYRHYPIDKPNARGQILHPDAGTKAQAAECVASLGGNDAFWKYTDALFNTIPQADPSSLLQLPIEAKKIGIDEKQFNDCLSAGTFKDKVEAMFQEGVTAEVRGTPQSYIALNGSLEFIPVYGAGSYEDISKVIDTLLMSKEVADKAKAQ
ncbi:thioredoxin domain-containing protein [Candidatus Nomurabacteria bacterium]|nr:thioredoxin domain-containing protein [Candidatus Nomurabacteria bacterium]